MMPHHFSVRVELTVRCVCVCVWAITFERNDVLRRYLERWFTLTLFRSSSIVKVQGHRMCSSIEDAMFDRKVKAELRKPVTEPRVIRRPELETVNK